MASTKLRSKASDELVDAHGAVQQRLDASNLAPTASKDEIIASLRNVADALQMELTKATKKDGR